MASPMESQSFLPLLNGRNFDQAAELRMRVMITLLYLILFEYGVYLAAYVISGRYNLIPWLVVPYVLPTLAFLVVIKRSQSYRACLLFILYLFSLAGLTRLISEPTYLVELIMLPVFIGTAFLVLELRHAFAATGYLLALIAGATAIAWYWAPFDLVYTNDNRASVVTALLVSTFGSVILYGAFALYFQRSSQLLGDALVGMKKINDDNQLLISVFSHDFRNHIARVLLQVEKGREQCRDEEQRKAVDGMEHAIHELVQLLDEVRHVRSLCAGAEGQHETSVSCSDLFRKAGLIFRNQLLEKSLVLDGSSCVDFEVKANPDILLHLILGNVLGNAIKFAPPGSTISYSTGTGQATRLLTITNAAEPVHATNLQAIAARQVVPSSLNGTAGEKGQGMGVDIVRRFCRAQGIGFRMQMAQAGAVHGGQLRVETCLDFS